MLAIVPEEVISACMRYVPSMFDPNSIDLFAVFELPTNLVVNSESPLCNPGVDFGLNCVRFGFNGVIPG